MKRLRFSWRYALIILGVFFLAYLVMDFNNRTAELRRLSLHKEVVAAEVTSLVRTQVYLETQMAHAASDAAVEQWAYEQGNLARPGDQPVVPIAPPGSTPAPTPTPVVEQTVVSNWQMWLWLFVDSSPAGGETGR